MQQPVPVRLLPHADILCQGSGIDIEVLERRAELPPVGRDVEASDVRAILQDAAGCGIVKAQQQLDQGGLSGAVPPYYGYLAPFPDGKVDSLKPRRAVWVLEEDIFERTGSPFFNKAGPGGIFYMAWDFIDIPNSFSESAVFQEIGPNPHEFLQPALYLASSIDRNDERRDGQLSPEQDHHAQVQGNQEVDAECAAERFLPKGQTPDPPAAVRRDSLLFLYRILVVGQKGIVYEAEPVVLAILRQIQQAAQEGQLLSFLFI